MKLIFFGKLDSKENYLESGVSVAGCEIQKRIIQEISDSSSNELEIMPYASQTGRSWPYGSFIKKGFKKEGITFLLTVNIPFFRELIFGLQAAFLLLKNKPKFIVQYNIFPCLNVAVLLYQAISKSRSIIVVQDYAKGDSFNIARVISDYISGKVVRYYSKAIVVTSALSRELKIKRERLTVFPGAVEHSFCVEGKGFFPKREGEINVVFAGALTKYNGVDKLLDNINNFPSNSRFHMFGDGPLRSLVKKYSDSNHNIFFYGKTKRDVVEAALSDADVNVCLRYSAGLDARFFFPSKFFSVNCFKGFVLVNDFPSLPEDYKKIGAILNCDFDNVGELLMREDLRSITRRRQELLFSNYQWSYLFAKLLK